MLNHGKLRPRDTLALTQHVKAVPPLLSATDGLGRAAALGCCVLTSLQLVLAPPSLALRGPTPLDLARSIEFGVTTNGTVRACPSNVNPNCISTASTNDDNYSAPLRAKEVDPQEAAKALRSAVFDTFPEATLQEFSRVEGVGEYLKFGIPSNFGTDVMEFLIKPEVVGRNWEGDLPGALVTYRSIAGEVKYIYPFQVAIPDGGAQKKRIQALKDGLGWSLIGCELVECFVL